jgi:hypothetical protein
MLGVHNNILLECLCILFHAGQMIEESYELAAQPHE